MMNRRHLLRMGGMAGATAALTACGGNTQASGATSSSSNERFSWTLSMIVPKTFPLWADLVIRFADRVRLMSGGRLDITVKGIGEKIKGLDETFDAVQSGRIEMAHSAAYYWIRKADTLQAAAFFTSIPFGMDAGGMSAWLTHGQLPGPDKAQTGQELWDELYAPHGLKALPCGNTGIQAGGWFNKPINSINDFKGLKMRIPGLGGQILTRIGASTENIPAGDIYLALQTGRIDATEWVGPFHDSLQKFHQVAPYYYTDGWHEPGSTLELLMNKEAWDSLPADLQAIVTACAAECDRDMAAGWGYHDSIHYAKLREKPDLKIQAYPDSVIEALRPIADEVINEVRDSSPIAKKIHDSYRAFQKDYQAWYALNTLPYVRHWGS